MRTLLLFSLFVFGLQAWASSENFPAVASSLTWRRLLHFKGSRSQIDGGKFFISPEGYQNPLAELRADVESFQKGERICDFPERFRFLNTELKLGLVFPKCAEFEEFKTKVNARSVSLVFSSAYPNNPASAFGHTFLKFNSKSGNELLDFGVNYAAQVSDDENPFAFLIYGVFGGYIGKFSLEKYFFKVNEYVNSESRDLWEYELSLSQEEVDRLIAHLWELEMNSFSAYYFFDENCSYQLLSDIEVVRPDWELTDFPIYVIPGESVKQVTEIQGAVRAVKFRPSLFKKLKSRYEGLSSEEKDVFHRVKRGDQKPEALDSPLILEALTSYFQFRKQRNKELNPQETTISEAVLVRRSQLGPLGKMDEDKLGPIAQNTRPDLGHDSYRLGLGAGQLGVGSPNQNFQEFSIKSAYHDLLGNDLGFMRYSQIDFPALEFRYYAEDKILYLEKFTGLQVISLFPLNSLDKRLSWKFFGGASGLKDIECRFCQAGQIQGGFGLAHDLGRDEIISYLLLQGRAEVSQAFAKGWRLGPVVEGGFVVNPWPKWKTQIAGMIFGDYFYEGRLENSMTLDRNWEIRGSLGEIFNIADAKPKFIEYRFSLYHYFN